MGITQSVSAAVRTLEERIAQVRRHKEAAIDAQDFGRAAALRDTEKRLLEERVRVEQEAAAGAGPEAGVGAGVGAVAGARSGAEGGSGAGVGLGLEGCLGRRRGWLPCR
jgi:hypothetical protein